MNSKGKYFLLKCRLQKEMPTILFFFVVVLVVFSSTGLVVGLKVGGSPGIPGTECSRICESENCSVPPLLRYGKYCGFMYSGCPGEKPCDGLDACCMKHDACVESKNNDYLSTECNSKLLDCMAKYGNAMGATFKGNTCAVSEVVDVITVVIEAAVLAGRLLHRP